MLPAAELLCRFESLGRNCEFGFVQRLAGAEPMGLLRFAGLPFEQLIRGLRTRFAGLADPRGVDVVLEDNEYRVYGREFSLRYHTHLYDGEIDHDDLVRIERRKIRFLAAQLIEDLDQRRKIFVFQQREALAARDLAALLGALAQYGATLLWVVAADATHEAGTVEVIDDRLMLGYVASLAPTETVHEPHLASWLAVCGAAFRLWTRAPAASADTAATGEFAVAGSAARGGAAWNGGEAGDGGVALELGFGADGAAGRYRLDGWSAAEPDLTWAVGRQSRLALPRQGTGDALLGLSVRPFVSPPALPSQRLSIVVNDVEIASFSLRVRTQVQCPIPAALLDSRDRVDITFRHPDAAAPSGFAAAGADTRELAFAFQRLALHSLGNAHPMPALRSRDVAGVRGSGRST